jgi:N-acetyl-anhydromuramyl-L-alanine amidase AmpD
MSPLKAPDRPSIIVCGEELELAGDVKVVRFKENPEWSYAAMQATHPEFRYFYPRLDKSAQPVTDLARLKDVVNKIVLHTDVARTAADCFRILVEEGLSSHFIIDWDGTIYQTCDPMYTTLHAGEVNKLAIGFDLNNVLPNLAAKGYSSVTYAGEMAMVPGVTGIDDPQSPFYRPRGTRRKVINRIECMSYGYCDAQYTAFLAVLKALLKVLPNIKPYPPMDESGQVILNVIDDYLGFEGIMAHWHISATRWDPGPEFDWDRMVAGLAEEHNSFPFLLEERQNIATLMARDKVEKAAEAYYANTEQGAGGYYPIGLYQNWHDGVHLHPPERAEVLNMVDGTLVAAHFAKKPTLLGSNNFVLLRHDLELPSVSSQGKASRKTLKVYSLYMHLGPMSLEPGPDAPPWVQHLHRVDSGEGGGQESGLSGDRKKGKASEGKGGASGAGAAGADDDERLDFEKKRVEFPFLEVGKGLYALKQGHVALFPLEPDLRIRVASNERLGWVGTFGEEGDREPLLHVEVFADDAWRDGIDMNRHGDFWVELEEDLKDDLVVDNEEILQMIAPRAQRLRLRRNGEVALKPSEIEDFFTDPDAGAKSYLRRAVVRHVAEWSASVDWVKALSKGQGWQALIETVQEWTDQDGNFVSGFFMDEIRKFLPFVWLTEDVCKHIGLDAPEGIVYTFHPIYFLMWLTFRSAQRIQVLSSGKTEQELREAYKKEMAALEEARKKRIRDENAENFAEGTIAWDLDLVEATPDEVMEDLKQIRFPDQWRVEEGDDE